MVFVRTKEIPPDSGNWYAYRVKNYRDESGEHHQNVVEYLGPVSDKDPSEEEIQELIEEKEEPSPEEILPKSVSLTLGGEPPEETVRDLSEFFSDVSNEFIENQVDELYITSEKRGKKTKVGTSTGGLYSSGKISLFQVDEDANTYYTQKTLLHEMGHGVFHGLKDRADEVENIGVPKELEASALHIRRKKGKELIDFAEEKKEEIREELGEFGYGVRNEEEYEKRKKKLEQGEHDITWEIKDLEKLKKRRQKYEELYELEELLFDLSYGNVERTGFYERAKRLDEKKKEFEAIDKYFDEEELKTEVGGKTLDFRPSEIVKSEEEPLEFLEENLKHRESIEKEEVERAKKRIEEGEKARDILNKFAFETFREGGLTSYAKKYQKTLKKNLEESEKPIKEDIQETISNLEEGELEVVNPYPEIHEDYDLFDMMAIDYDFKRAINENLAESLGELVRRSIEYDEPEKIGESREKVGENLLIKELISDKENRGLSEETIKEDLESTYKWKPIDDDWEKNLKTGKTVLEIIGDKWDVDLEEFKKHLEEVEGSN